MRLNKCNAKKNSDVNSQFLERLKNWQYYKKKDRKSVKYGAIRNKNSKIRINSAEIQIINS